MLPLAASADDSGTCGSDVTWTYTESTHKLIISGTGKMTNYGNFQYYNGNSASWNNNAKPWDSYLSDIQVVEINDGVTSIGNFSFTNCKSLTTVKLSDSVNSIGEGAFWGCTYLYSLSLGNGLTSIGLGAFMECNGLISLKIPDNLTSIGNYAFYNCSSLTSVSLPSSLTSFGSNVFAGCNSITSLHISDIAAWCNMNLNNSILSANHHLYVSGSEVKDLVIPNGVKSIGNYAFQGCAYLTSVSIPSSVTSIGSVAFEGCNNIAAVHTSDIAAWCTIQFKSNPLSIAHHLYLNGTEVKDLVIPNGVTSISSNSFSGCSGLTSVNIPSSVTSISEWAFNDCTNLASVVMNNGVTTIGNSVFWGCGALSSVTLSNSVTAIGEFSFYGCSALSSITLPSSINSIGRYAFYGCSGLSNLAIPNGITIIPEGAFYECSGLTTIIMPDELSIIRSSAFAKCSYLESVNLPATVEAIYQNVFNGCTNLQSIYVHPTTPPIIYDNTFPNYNVPVTVPTGYVDTYKAAQGWSNFNTINDGNMYYQLTVTSGSHGTVTYVGETVTNSTKVFDVKEGSDAMLTITPEENFQVATVTVNGEDAISQLSNGVLTIGNLTAKTAVAVTFKIVAGYGEHIKMAVATGDRTAIGYSSALGLDFTNVEDVKAWIVSGFTDDAAVLLSRVKVVPPNTGLYLTSDIAGVEVDVPMTDQDVWYANLLVAAVNEETIQPTEMHDGVEYTNFVVGRLTSGNMGFVRVTASRTLGPNKSRLLVPSSYYSVTAPSLRVEFIDEPATNIKGLHAQQQQNDGYVHDLQGRRLPVGQARRGLYIYKGRKYVIR